MWFKDEETQLRNNVDHISDPFSYAGDDAENK
jgi:hypothetical protein